MKFSEPMYSTLVSRKHLLFFRQLEEEHETLIEVSIGPQLESDFREYSSYCSTESNGLHYPPNKQY